MTIKEFRIKRNKMFQYAVNNAETITMKFKAGKKEYAVILDDKQIKHIAEARISILSNLIDDSKIIEQDNDKRDINDVCKVLGQSYIEEMLDILE